MGRKVTPGVSIEPSRRQLLQSTACGFGHVALMGMLNGASQRLEAGAVSSGTQPLQMPHFAPRAKRVIFLFMHGGVSHVDSFDPKVQLLIYRKHPIVLL